MKARYRSTDTDYSTDIRGLSQYRKARGTGPVHRQSPFRPHEALCGASLLDPMVRRNGKSKALTCPECVERNREAKAAAKAELARVEAGL